MRRRGLGALTLVLAGTVAAAALSGAVLEADRSAARTGLGAALGALAPAPDAPPARAAAWVRARAAHAAGDLEALTEALAGLAAAAPGPQVHAALSLARRAAGDAAGGARHALLAARLAPDDPGATRRADAALDRATLARVWGPLEAAGWAAGGLLAALALRAAARRRRRRRLERYAEQVSGELRPCVDGVAGALRLEPWHEQAALDLFLKGRLGLARPRPPRRAPPLKLRLSHAGAGRTVRLAERPALGSGAARVRLGPGALAALRAHPGTWRAAAVVADRVVACCTLEVAPP